MKPIFIFRFIFSLCFSCSYAQISAHYGGAKFTPNNGDKLLIMGQDLGGVGGLSTHSDGYVDAFSKIPAGVTTYTDLVELKGLKTLSNWGAGDIHADAYFNDSTFNNSFLVIGLYMVDILPYINEGYLDSKIIELGEWIKSKNRPIYLRIGYEFDGSWNDYNPDEFKTAWKHIVHVFDELEVKNVAYVWQSSGGNHPNINLWYPGDDYVNWLGYSYFNGSNMGQSIRDFAETHNKPIMIAEATPKRDLKQGDSGVHWNAWFAPLFSSIYSNDNVKALAYINTNWDSQSMWVGEGWGDSRLQEVASIKQNWEAEIAKSPWIVASENLFEDLNYAYWINQSGTLSVKKKDDNLVVLSNSMLPLNGLVVYNLFGQVLYETTKNDSNYNIPLKMLDKGILILKVAYNNRIETHKIMF